jgi:hypothetical protein
MNEFLTAGKDSEVAEVTGAKQKKRQIECLSRNGLRFIVRRDGWPTVHRSEIEHGQPPAEPNFKAMEG